VFNLPHEMFFVLSNFSHLFTKPVWNNACILITGSILCIGKRTVTSALTVMGLRERERFTNFHRVLNRAKWSSIDGSKILLGLLVNILPNPTSLIIVVDETIERRKGEKIKAKGCYRDAVRSSQKKVIHCFGLKWISMMLIVPVPWATRVWALPFLTVLAPSKACNEAEGKRHKTTVDWTCQMINQVRRWFPKRAMVLVGDGAYAAVALALQCTGFGVPVALVARFRLDACLYDPPPPNQPGKRGPKPKKGKRQPSLLQRSQDDSTEWSPIDIVWYDGIKRSLEIFSGISLWHKAGNNPVPVKWVVVRDPKGNLRTEAFFCTDLEVKSKQILQWVIYRWNIEVTFEELRAHLGLETQRQWSDLAILRTTPALFAMFSIIVLMAMDILKGTGNELPILKSAWYDKQEATFSDVIALVRRHIWSARYLTESTQNNDKSYFQQDLLETLLDQVCYAT
jgi:hypothetical protein